MYSLDSLLDDINTIDKDFGTKSTEVKTIKFTPHPPTTGKGKESSQLSSVSNIGHLENPKYKFVATSISSSSSASKSTSSPSSFFTQDLPQTKKQGSPKEDKDRDHKFVTSTTTKASGDKREPDLLDDLLYTLSNSPPVPTKVVAPFYKPSSSSSSSGSIVFNPANSSSAFDLNVFPSIGTNYFSSPSTTTTTTTTTAASARDSSSNYSENALLTDPKTQLQTINANSFGSGKFKDSAAESGKGSGPSAAKARCSKLMLAGTAISRGLKSSAFSKCACDNLRCLQCNFTVHWFRDSTWDSSVDYLFLRNNMPNDGKLSSKVLSSPGSCAYCCQCSWIHVSEEKQLITGHTASDPQWVCAGH